nr:MAG TPA: hypothetical protein [Caudoviricetes sp.]
MIFRGFVFGIGERDFFDFSGLEGLTPRAGRC